MKTKIKIINGKITNTDTVIKKSDLDLFREILKDRIRIRVINGNKK